MRTTAGWKPASSREPDLTPWFGSNLKMALDRSQTSALVECARRFASAGPRVLVVSAPFLAESVERANGTGLRIGAQGCSVHARGAFTGQVSAEDIASVGCDVVMIGHAERVAAGETPADMAAQVRQARGAGLSVILCVGEIHPVHDPHSVEALTAQVTMILGDDIRAGDVMAYEPHWAIGESGSAPSPEYLHARFAGLRAALGHEATIVYGGSVAPDNARSILAVPGCDGLFVGRSAWTVAGWEELESLLAAA